MPKTALPTFTFETGLCLLRRLPSPFNGAWRTVPVWMVVGRLATGVPFFLQYQGQGTGHTQWFGPTHLGDSLRKKILDRFRVDVRTAEPPPAFLVHQDLQALDARNLDEGNAEALRLSQAFFNGVWRAQYLNDRDEDWVSLNVPYAERPAAQQLGAEWHPLSRTWRVHTRQNLALFARWLPT
jgi:hypothetical protein